MRYAIGILLAGVIFLLFPLPGNRAFGQEPKSQTAQTKDELKLHAQSAVLMDGVTGRILYGKNEDQTRPMASTTKIMTCILALEYGNLEDKVTASQNAAAQPKVHLGVRKGETFLLKDLLYSLMLESHNDSAMMIAEHIGGSREGFAELMNQKARDLGCKNTYFITPNGLDAREEKDGQVREHSTTAADLAHIMNYCIGQSPKKKEFLEITGTQSYYFRDQEGKRSFTCSNHNALLTMMSGAFSGKTGFTGGAGYTYVGSVLDEGRTYTIALLGCGWPPHKTYKWSDARSLLQYGMDRFHYREVYKEPSLPDILVKSGIASSGRLEDPVSVSCTLGEEEKSLKLLLSDDEKVTMQTKIQKELTAPVYKGQAVGTITYKLNGEAVKTYPIYADGEVNRLTLSWCVKRIFHSYLTMEDEREILPAA